jgi:phosphoribosyl-AMP cyclohydrolase
MPGDPGDAGRRGEGRRGAGSVLIGFNLGADGAISPAMSELFPPPGPTDALERGRVLTPNFDADGLIPAICQHADTGEVVMVGYMNAASLKLTLETGEAHYFSRKRQALWKKGETSGQIQTVVEMMVDCDQDAIVIRIRPGGDGGVCHTGEMSCFYRVVEGGALVPREGTVLAGAGKAD